MTQPTFIEWRLITSSELPLSNGIVMFDNCYIYTVDTIIESNNNIILCFSDDTEYILQSDDKIYYIDDDTLLTIPKL